MGQLLGRTITKNELDDKLNELVESSKPISIDHSYDRVFYLNLKQRELDGEIEDIRGSFYYIVFPSATVQGIRFGTQKREVKFSYLDRAINRRIYCVRRAESSHAVIMHVRKMMDDGMLVELYSTSYADELNTNYEGLIKDVIRDQGPSS